MENVRPAGSAGRAVYHCNPHNPRALDAGELAAFLRRYGKPVTACDTIREGVSRMLADTPPDGTAVCCGSLYLLGDVVQSLEKV